MVSHPIAVTDTDIYIFTLTHSLLVLPFSPLLLLSPTPQKRRKGKKEELKNRIENGTKDGVNCEI